MQAWDLTADGEPFDTHASHLLPVRLGGDSEGRPAMIKIARHLDEQIGGKVMQWWNGHGAAQVYAYDESLGVLLMERATGSGNLLNMALEGSDDVATRIVCDTIMQLHSPRNAAQPKQLLALADFFESLAPMARREGGLMSECAIVADELLASPREQVVLHGDAHHNNILDFGERGWLAIDPKRVIGERCYDYVNVLCNPELKTCIESMRFTKQLDIVVESARVEPRRLLQWVMAHAALSAAWFLEDGEHEEAHKELAVARLAKQALC